MHGAFILIYAQVHDEISVLKPVIIWVPEHLPTSTSTGNTYTLEQVRVKSTKRSVLWARIPLIRVPSADSKPSPISTGITKFAPSMHRSSCVVYIKTGVDWHWHSSLLPSLLHIVWAVEGVLPVSNIFFYLMEVNVLRTCTEDISNKTTPSPNATHWSRTRSTDK